MLSKKRRLVFIFLCVVFFFFFLYIDLPEQAYKSKLFQAAYIASSANITFHLRLHGGAFEHSKNSPGKRKQFSLWPWLCKAFIRLCCSRQYYIFIPKYWQDSDFSTSTAWGEILVIFCFLPPASPQRMMVCFMLNSTQLIESAPIVKKIFVF